MKLALITGGSKGLGKALVDKYIEMGFKVLEYSRSGSSEYSVKCDFSDPLSASQILDSSLLQFKNLEFSDIVMINNVGTIDPIGPISEFGFEDWLTNINVNYASCILASGIFGQYFQNHPCNKCIVAISSGAAIKSKYGWSLYCSAKAGLEQFMRTLAMEQDFQTNPIKSIIIDPSIIDTGMQASIRNANEDMFPELGRFIGFKSKGDLLTPFTVAEKIFNIVSSNCQNGTKYTVSDN